MTAQPTVMELVEAYGTACYCYALAAPHATGRLRQERDAARAALSRAVAADRAALAAEIEELRSEHVMVRLEARAIAAEADRAALVEALRSVLALIVVGGHHGGEDSPCPQCRAVARARAALAAAAPQPETGDA